MVAAPAGYAEFGNSGRPGLPGYGLTRARETRSESRIALLSTLYYITCHEDVEHTGF